MYKQNMMMGGMCSSLIVSSLSHPFEEIFKNLFFESFLWLLSSCELIKSCAESRSMEKEGIVKIENEIFSLALIDDRFG
jgi:hypothetical protein